MTATATLSAPSGLRWWHCFAAWGLITVLWSFSVGIGGSPDEPAHIIKAAAVADGQFNTDTTWEPMGDRVSAPRTYVRVPAAYQRLYRGPSCWSSDLEESSDCDEFPTTKYSRRIVDGFTYVGTYPPTYYLAVGWPTRFLPPDSAVYGMRVVSALISAAFLAEGTFLFLRRRPHPWLLTASAVAVPPSVLLMSASVNPNGMEVAAAVCLWASGIVLARGTPVDGRAILSAAVAAVALAWIRPLGPAYALIVLVIAFGTLLPASEARAVFSSRSSKIFGAAVGLAIAAAVAFAVANHSYSSLITYGKNADRSPSAAAQDAANGLGDNLQKAWGLLGPQSYETLTLQSWILLPWLGFVALMLFVALLKGGWQQRVGLSILTLGCVLGPIVPSVASRGTPWQGRYILPLLVGVPLLSGAVLARSATTPSSRAVRSIPAAAVGFVALAFFAAHQLLMNRTAVGLPARPFANLSADSWPGPVSPLALLIWAMAASVCWAAMMASSARQPATDEQAQSGVNGERALT